MALITGMNKKYTCTSALIQPETLLQVNGHNNQRYLFIGQDKFLTLNMLCQKSYTSINYLGLSQDCNIYKTK